MVRFSRMRLGIGVLLLGWLCASGLPALAEDAGAAAGEPGETSPVDAFDPIDTSDPAEVAEEEIAHDQGSCEH